MNDVTVIDRFLDTFSRYIDSGFGLLQGEVAYLTATLIAIDMTIAGLYWSLGHATGQGEDVMAKLIRKVLYVGAFAYIIGNFNWLAGIVFRSFAGLGLTATGALSMETFLQPGRLAKAGIDAGAPILEQIGELTGFPEVFVNLDPIVILFLAYLVVIVCFFVLAVQLFITLIEFKLTTLAGFVLVPFALWNKTAFLAEKVLGNVVSSGVKVLVLAVIVGIGTGLFAEFQVHPDEPSIDHALVVMLASLALLALGIFGPGIATGLISGGPQLGRGLWRAPHSAWRVRPSPSAPMRLVSVLRLRPGRVWRRPPPGWLAVACVPPPRQLAVRVPHSNSDLPLPVAASRAPRPAWAALPRSARRQQDRGLPLVCVRSSHALLPPSKPKGLVPLLAPAGAFKAMRPRGSLSTQPPLQRRSLPGPNACRGASRSAMPPPPSRTRCAVETAVERAVVRACGIRTHKEGKPCASNDRGCVTPRRHNPRPRTRLPPRHGTSASARPACGRRTGV